MVPGGEGRRAFEAADVGQAQGLFDQGAEVVVLNPGSPFDAGHLVAVESRAVGRFFLQRHDAVGVDHTGAGPFFEQFRLIVPGAADVAFQVGMLAQLRVAVGGQHLRVGVDVDALALGGHQQLGEHIQIVPGNQDSLAFGAVLAHLHRGRNPEGAGMGAAEQIHHLHPGVADLHKLSDVLVKVEVDVGHGEVEGFTDDVVHLDGIGAQLFGVFPVGGQTLESEDHQILQPGQIGILAAGAEILILAAAAVGGAHAALVAEHVQGVCVSG